MFKRNSPGQDQKAEIENPAILLIGIPNVGKTTIFNHLTRKYAITANYPFTTVGVNSDRIQIENQVYELIDTAGIYRLNNPSEEGQETRELIFSTSSKIIVQIIEAAKLEQSLLLTAQLLELKQPMMIVLNMTDELAKHGTRINSQLLSEHLGVPVIETIATEGKGIERLKKFLVRITTPLFTKNYPLLCEKYFNEIRRLFPEGSEPPTTILSLLALDDLFAIKWINTHYGQSLADQVAQHHKNFLDKNVVNLSITLLNSENFWINKISQDIISRKEEITKFGLQKIGEYSRHPLWGWLILTIFIFLTYLIVGKFGASFLVAALDQNIFSPLIRDFNLAITHPFLNRLLVGDYGLLTVGLFNAIGTVLPIITLFFIVLNLMEDTGYLTNLIILTSRVFKKIGLTGKSILPIILGFGCKTMATLSTKILDTKKEKYIAIFLIGLAIPCSSQMSINMAVLSREPLLAFGLVILILSLIELVAGLILNYILPQKERSDFIIEIPPVRIPDLKHLLKKTYYRSIWFLKEAVPLFLLGAIILFILDETSAMRLLEKALQPIVVGFLKLPINFAEAMVMSLARSEAGAVLIMSLANKGQLNTTQVMTAVIVITLFIPCISNVMAIVKEIKLKKALIMVTIITTTSIVIGGLVNYFLKLFNFGG